MAEAHHARVDERTRAHLTRRARGEKHAVEDFIWTYYRHRPAQLRRWHPGPDVALEDAPDHAGARFYRAVPAANAGVPGPDGSEGSFSTSGASTRSVVALDISGFMERKGGLVRHVHDLLVATADRPPAFGCFGLHEWAMVYRDADHRRHPAPLRLGAAGTDEVVESLQVTCTHYDAYRFFTAEAAPLNRHRPTRAAEIDLEQPACLHAGMDLYRFAGELLPAVPSELVLDCFDHALRARHLDMAASPYELGYLGIEPVRIETPAGRAEYVRRQRELAEAAAPLRQRLIDATARLLAVCE